MSGRLWVTRRLFLASASCMAVSGGVAARTVATPNVRVRPVPASHVRLKPSPFAQAVAANRAYLLSLDPERLLHNFYESAGLPAPKSRYGGWESAGIAGHSLGHWVSACALRYANDGDPDIGATLDHALAEMARIQARQGDGYLCGTTVWRDGKTLDGKLIFEEIRRGDIVKGGWELNGGWVPVYTYHKIIAGLIDAYALAGKKKALPIALGMADYFGSIVEGLSDEQVQAVLRIEHGGIAESFAELHALTADLRWLKIAERLKHDAVVDPLLAGQDRLAGLHANTQIPKIIGLARLYELTGNPAYAAGARFFHERVSGHHSYIIGGNSEREHFGPPDRLNDRLTTATCEACNSYNMLKLTRHLYSWDADAAWFDFYERVQFNHILAHQRPDTGQFVYFMPLETGAKRDYSTAENSFWCCVGSGMESHAKHADSLYWEDDRTIYVNLYVPSTLDLPARRLRLELDTAYPQDGRVDLTVAQAPARAMRLALRIARWAPDAELRLNGARVDYVREKGYAVLDRVWKAGDKVQLSIPMTLRTEALKGDDGMVGFLSGPLVLAADVGPADQHFTDAPPAILTQADAREKLVPTSVPHQFALQPILGGSVVLKPFYPLYDRRTAVYFRTFTPDGWAQGKDRFLAEEAARADLVRRTVDVFHIGEMQPERDHALQATGGGPGEFYGKKNRAVPSGQSMRFTVTRRAGPGILQLTYWGYDVDRVFDILVDGRAVATETRPGPGRGEWVVVDYPLPPATSATSLVEIRAKTGDAVIYGVRVLTDDRPAADGKVAAATAT